MAINTTATPNKSLRHSGLGIVSIILSGLFVFFMGAATALSGNNTGIISGLMFVLGAITPFFGLIFAILEFKRENRKKLFPMIAILTNGIPVLILLSWLALWLLMALNYYSS